MLSSTDKLDIPPSWKQAAEEAIRCKGTVMAIGASDSGKSTLVRYLLHSLLKAGRRTALVDADVGQSALGPPATISMALLHDADATTETLQPQKMRFVGSISPAGHVLEAVVGAAMMVQRAHEMGAELIVVDTDGMVQGQAASQLKYNQVALVNPALLLALQKEREIEPLLASLSGVVGGRLRRLPVSAWARSKPYSEKANNRRLRFLSYFSEARDVTLDFSHLAFQGTPIGTGLRLTTEEANFVSRHLDTSVLHAEKIGDTLFLVVSHRVEGGDFEAVTDKFSVRWINREAIADYADRLVGLCDRDGDCLALGTIKGINFASKIMELSTPLRHDAFADVALVHFGSIKVEPAGKEQWIKRQPR